MNSIPTASRALRLSLSRTCNSLPPARALSSITRLRNTPPPPPPLLRIPRRFPREQHHHHNQPSLHHRQLQQCRHESSTTAPKPLTDRPEQAPSLSQPREEQPSYEMTFTCKICTDRSTHRITKQGYHHGTILISCPGCKNRHLIADHMKIFSDTSITMEDILREKGMLLKKGELGSEGDIEFWDDGTQTERKKEEEK